jgi:proline racemase
MRTQTVRFVKGHMGGNEIVLLDGERVPEGQELSVGLALLDSPNIRGHQGALLYKGGGNRLRAKIISVSSRGFISSCGGLTQVLGKVLLETDFMRKFQLRIDKPPVEFELETDAGDFTIIIENHNAKANRVISVMTPFVEECYHIGVTPMEAAGVRVMKVGKVLVVDGDDLREVYPGVNLDQIDKATMKTLSTVQQSFLAAEFPGQVGGDFAVYDLNPAHGGNGRVIFPHSITAGHIEPSCGTGTVAVGIAVVESGKVSPDEGKLELSFESGGSSSAIGGPDITELQLTVKDRRVTDARFSHSFVEIIATGKAWV